MDSSWFRAFAQGSVPYAAALASLLAAPLAIRNARFGRALVPLSMLVAVAYPVFPFLIIRSATL